MFKCYITLHTVFIPIRLIYCHGVRIELLEIVAKMLLRQTSLNKGYV